MRVGRPAQRSACWYNALRQWLACKHSMFNISGGKSPACLDRSYIILHGIHCCQVRLASRANDNSLVSLASALGVSSYDDIASKHP